MPGSPLRKNYVHQIKNICPYPTKTNEVASNYLRKTLIRKKSNQNDIQIFNNCIRSKVYPQNSRQSGAIQKDYFDFILFENGIFNINKIHPSSIKNSEQKRNLTKQCIPTEQRLLKSLYLFPTQTIVQCQYDIQNRFHKEMIFYSPGQYLIVNNFTNGKMDKEQYNFNLKDLILVKTCFQKDRLKSVKDYLLTDQIKCYGVQQLGKQNLKVKLQKYFKDKQLCQTIYRLTQGYFDWLQPIQIKSCSSSYYGKLSYEYDLPDGLGLLINRKTSKGKSTVSSQKFSKLQTQNFGLELYCGVFKQGVLDILGSIWFLDKSSYFGQFDSGNFVGLGQFFSLNSQKKRQSDNNFQCFSFKDDTQTIKKDDFFRWIRQGFFNGMKQTGNKQTICFIQNQYQKLRKIYAIAKKKQTQPVVQVQQKIEQIKQQQPHDSEQIDDLVEEMNKVSFNNSKTKKQILNQSQISFNKNDNIRDIFQKIRINNPKTQKYGGGNSQKKIFDLNRINTDPHQQLHTKITSRSDDHAYENYKRNGTKNSHQKQKQVIQTTIKQLQNQEDQDFNDYHFNYQNFDKKIDSNQENDLGFEEADSQYFRNKQQVSTFNNYKQNDYIPKQYAFQNPKSFKTPDYFIIQNSKSHLKVDPNISSNANLMQQDNLKKNNYSSSSTLRRDKYLSPSGKHSQEGQKQNEAIFKKYEQAINTGKIRKIFYNPNPNR